ncbi:ABC transporter permease [Nocardioides sp. Kera G14]|uniref:ABC transporter permease n=1 Tax=Nocardioides sp. Kera G14 TaxID=2884264 RepID=UPI001D0FE89D|nr:ABC transporter permease [Nocardioides sp. Kera G14]UDY22170.1 ABC transporter permease [Nocardioides sp. Kera G14]
MLAYVVRRVFVGVVMLLVMSLVTFVLFFASPVDPARFSAGKNPSEELLSQVRKSLGYPEKNQGPLKDYLINPAKTWGDFVKGVAVGRDYPDDPELRRAHPEQVVHCAAPCFGYSKINNKTVNEEISKALPVTVSLSLAAVIFWIIGGLGIGIIAAIRKGTWLDRGIVAASLLVYAFPVFFTGTFLLRYVSIKWGLWPVPAFVPFTENPVNWAINLVLPGLTLAGLVMAAYVRVTRSFVLESLSEDYVRTARAKGLKTTPVIFKHALRAALTPLVTMFGLDLATMLVGAIITERVFNYQGLGYISLLAAQTFDLPTLIGMVVFAGSVFILANLIVDILYSVIDPRVRVS